MLVVALVGLAVNVVAASILARAAGESLNVQAALRHVFADLASSVGVAVAAIVILATGWNQADPIAGMAIACLILASTWSILRDSVVILLEATPSGIDAGEVGRRMAAAEGVVEVHDLHIWTITSGFPALSAHVLVARGDDCHARRLELEQMLAGEFGLQHTTLQVEHVGEQRGLQIRPLRRQLQLISRGFRVGSANAKRRLQRRKPEAPYLGSGLVSSACDAYCARDSPRRELRGRPGTQSALEAVPRGASSACASLSARSLAARSDVAMRTRSASSARLFRGLGLALQLGESDLPLLDVGFCVCEACSRASIVRSVSAAACCS